MTLHTLPAGPDTVRVGVIDRAHAPVLTVDSGDRVELQTWGLWANGVIPGDSYERIVALKAQYAGKGPHSITGPIAVRGARAGMLLRVDLEALQLGPHGFNLITPPPASRGLLSHEFPEGQIRHFLFDHREMSTELLPGFRIPLRPFLGILGVAPAAHGPHISSVPGPFGGNMDCVDLVAGCTVYLPIWVDGALFYAGDAHAAQGSGEVCQTAIETSMDRVRLRLTVVEQARLPRPHAVADTHLLTMGFHEDLRQAAIQAVDDMVTWLALEYGFTRADAYVLCSLQADLMVTQAVNKTNGVHARLPLALLAQCQARPRPDRG